MRFITSILYISMLLAIDLDHNVSATLDQADEVDTTINLSDNYNTVNGGKPPRNLKKAKGVKTTKAQTCPSDVISLADLEVALGSVVISTPSLNTQSDGDVEILDLGCVLAILNTVAVCGSAGGCIAICYLASGIIPPLFVPCAKKCALTGAPACVVAITSLTSECLY